MSVDIDKLFEHIKSVLGTEASVEDVVQVIQDDFASEDTSPKPSWDELQAELEERYKDNRPNCRILSWDGEIVHQVRKGKPWPEMNAVLMLGEVVVRYDSHWGGDGVAEGTEVKVTLQSPTWKEFIEAVDKVVYESGDRHHIFWEGGKGVGRAGKSMVYTVHTGS